MHSFDRAEHRGLTLRCKEYTCKDGSKHASHVPDGVETLVLRVGRSRTKAYTAEVAALAGTATPPLQGGQTRVLIGPVQDAQIGGGAASTNPLGEDWLHQSIFAAALQQKKKTICRFYTVEWC